MDDDSCSPPRSAVREVYGRLRHRLGDVPAARSAHSLLRWAQDVATDGPKHATEWYDGVAAERDPYGYETKPDQRRRLDAALSMLDAARGSGVFDRALEVGCHEGAFTEVLAPRAHSVLATDISPRALERARARCAGSPNVRFELWDLRLDPVPGRFDLALLMDVVECIHRPNAMRHARDKIVDAIEPGGHLLITSSPGDQVAERSWWGRWAVRGGTWVNAFVARHPQLRLIQQVNESGHVIAILQKQPA